MNTAKDPAFPFVCDDVSKHQCHDPGIDIRTYLAAKFMQGILSNGTLYSEQWGDTGWSTMFAEIAQRSVQAADKLIEELSKQPEKPT